MNKTNQDEVIDLWAQSYDSKLSVMLGDQLWEELQSACRSLNLDSDGYSKKLTQRLMAFARNEASVTTGHRSHDDGEARKLRATIASLVTRKDLQDFVGMMEVRPSRFHALSRDDLESHFVEIWDGDLQELLNTLSAALLKNIYEDLNLDRPRYRS